MNVLSGEISCQVRAGAALYLWNVSALSLLTTPTPQPCHCEGEGMLFKKSLLSRVKDVGCRPIFHLRLKGGDLRREREREGEQSCKLSC